LPTSNKPALAVFAVCFAAYAWTASPALGWLDSPELVAAGASLGVSHSPGHPLAGLLGRLATLLPFGDMAFRVNVLSSLCGAAAATAVFAAGRGLLARVAPSFEGGTSDAAAAGAALAFALSWAAWFQGVRAEVYALQAALLGAALVALLAWERRREPRMLLVAGLACGLALAHHHWMALLFAVPAAVFALARAGDVRPSLRTGAATAVCGALGLAAFLYLPVRAAAHPEVNWGDPQTADRFAWTVSAQAFQKSAGAEHVSTAGEDTAEIVAALLDQATPVLMLAALLGLYLGVRTSEHRSWTLLLAGIAAAAAGGRVVLGFDPGTPDHYAYLLPALMAIVLLGLAGLARLAHLIAGSAPSVAAVAVAVAMIALVPWQASANAGASRLSGAYASDTLAREELEQLPPRSVVLVGYFQTSFRIAALRAVEESRPDVVVLDRSLLTYPGFAAVARARHPELAAIIDAPLRAGAPTPVDALRALGRPVAVQLHPNLDDAPKPALVPRGVYAWLQPARADADARDAAEPLDFAERDRLANALLSDAGAESGFAQESMLWLDFLRLDFYCEMGRVAAARRAFERARIAAPDDDMLAARAKACGIARR
jgi:MFS family permease